MWRPATDTDRPPWWRRRRQSWPLREQPLRRPLRLRPALAILLLSHATHRAVRTVAARPLHLQLRADDDELGHRRYSFAGSVVPSQAAMTAAISLLFFSFIITWLLPLMPSSASRMKVGCTPACCRYFTVQ